MPPSSTLKMAAIYLHHRENPVPYKPELVDPYYLKRIITPHLIKYNVNVHCLPAQAL
jgi:hypothetical protein